MIDEIYAPQTLEQAIQTRWAQTDTFAATEKNDAEKFYCLSMFPYPSGKLHMGHARNYTIGDVISRYQRLLGKNVLQPIGWDAFGLPAENAAIEKKVAPATWTHQNIDQMRAQLKRLGFAYDWNREITTCHPNYYRWEQWLFTKMFERGLAYKKNAIVNWDPIDKTVLANEQVINGRGWRSNAVIEQKEISQWFLKITDYAEELLTELKQLPGWPDEVLTMQRNWIGKSEGVEIIFQVDNESEKLSVYTTRPDTFMGATFIAIATLHPLAQKAMQNKAAIKTFIDSCQHTKMAEADLATLDKQGIDSGYKAIHPITGEGLPIWITNYVLMDYGSGAVMAVPAHDERDHEFAKKYSLPIKQVIKSDVDTHQQAFTEKGILINSNQFSNLSSEKACNAIADYLIEHKAGERKVNYRLRDWGISRQRYWGSPIPIIYCDDCGAVTVPEKDLPVKLPDDIIITGSGSPLANTPAFYQTTCPKCKKPAKRETDTFDTFMESSWYYARFTCPDQTKSMFDERVNYWTPVDQYIGGIEHACMHLLYARFIHKVMRDFGLIKSNEPFKNLLTQGMVLKDGSKMSKSVGNTVDPQSLIDQYGADTVRLFSIFAAPPEQSLEWSDSGVEGCYRFLKRLWHFAYKHQTMIQHVEKQSGVKEKNTRREIYLLLQQATHDMERLQFNTIVSAAMKILNILNDTDDHAIIVEGLSILLRILNPITPHITQHLWQQLHYGDNILTARWPTIDAQALQADTLTMVIQINGKRKTEILIPADATREQIEQLACAHEKVKSAIENKHIKKIIVVPKKLISIVIGDEYAHS